MKNIIAEYKCYRKKGKDLNGELFKELKRSDIKNAARLLGLLKKETLVLDSEEEMDRFTDFAINDYYDADGKTAVQRYKEKNCFSQKNTEEDKILEALLVSKPSLYVVNGVNTKASTVYLSDVFNKGDEIEMIDIGFSTYTAINNFLLFSRIISIDKIKMTSGAPFLFEKSKETILQDKYKKLYKKITVKNEQTKMAIAFFKLNQKFGYNVQYM